MDDEELREIVQRLLQKAIEAKRDGYWSKETRTVVELVAAVGDLEAALLERALNAFMPGTTDVADGR